MAIITLARQVGSGGQSIASALAEQLGYRQYGRRELRQLAEEAGLELPVSFERFANEDVFHAAGRDPLSQLHVSYGELEFDSALRGAGTPANSAPEPSFLDGLVRHRRDILLSLLSVIYQLAADDNVVLVGGGGQLLLADLPGVLRLKIVAPVDVRIERLASAYGMTPTAARAAIRDADREQRDYNRAVLGADWSDPLMWDLVVNTEYLTIDDVAALVCTLIRRPPLSHGLTAFGHDILSGAATINRAFWADAALRDTTIVATPALNGITLRGEPVSEQTRQQALALATTIVPSITIQSDLRPSSRRSHTSPPHHHSLPEADTPPTAR